MMGDYISSSLGALLTLYAFCLNIFLLYQFVKSRQTKISNVYSVFLTIGFVMAFFVSFVLLHTRFEFVERTAQSDAFSQAVFKMPMALLLLLLGAETVLAVYSEVRQRHYQKSHITNASIKETLDLLPSGICVYDGETMLLCNVKMDELCRRLTGIPLMNPAEFWKILRQNSISNYPDTEALIRFSDEEVYAFYRSNITVNSKVCFQIAAVNLTRQYRLNLELQRQNEHLTNMQERMKAYGKTVDEVVHNQEVLNAKMAVHNDMGEMLMMTKYALEHHESIDGEGLAAAWNRTVSILLNEAEEADDDILLKDLIRTAENVGIQVKIKGEIPNGGTRQRIFLRALHECITNTLKHAEGDSVLVEINENAFVFANTGKPPQGEIRESGGLKSLRQMTEGLGGEMQIESSPAFRLIIKI